MTRRVAKKVESKPKAQMKVAKRRGLTYITGNNNTVAGEENVSMSDEELDDDPHQGSEKQDGVMTIENGGLMFKPNAAGSEPIPAVYHHEIRKELLASAPTGTYDFPADGSKGEYDRTSFLPSQKTWGPDREHYPAITFQYKRLPGPNHPLYKPEEWYHKGRLVLDDSHRPVIHYRDIPDVVSSKFPGYAIEAIQRTDSRITLADILARMPPTVKTISPNAKKAAVIPSTNSLTQRTHRFRLKAGCLAWKVRKGSEAMEEFLEKHLSIQSKAANSTQDFRDLTKEERDGVEKKKIPKGEKSTAAAPSAATEEEYTQVEYDMEEADVEGEDDDLAYALSVPAAALSAPAATSATAAPSASATSLAATDEEYIQVEYGMEEADTEGKDDDLATDLSAATTPSTSATSFAAAASSAGTEEEYTGVDYEIGEADAEGEDDDFDATRWCHLASAAPSAAVVPSVAAAPSAAIEDEYTQVDHNIGEADAEGVDDDPDASQYFRDAMGDMDWV